MKLLEVKRFQLENTTAGMLTQQTKHKSPSPPAPRPSPFLQRLRSHFSRDWCGCVAGDV